MLISRPVPAHSNRKSLRCGKVGARESQYSENGPLLCLVGGTLFVGRKRLTSSHNVVDGFLALQCTAERFFFNMAPCHDPATRGLNPNHVIQISISAHVMLRALLSNSRFVRKIKKSLVSFVILPPSRAPRDINLPAVTFALL